MKYAGKLKDDISKEMDKEMKEKQKEREELLEKAPKNELVKKLVEKKDPEEKEKRWDEWGLIDDIVYCARDMYMSGDKSKKETVKLMIDALDKAMGDVYSE